MNYDDFIKNKFKTSVHRGIEPINLNPNLYDFQHHIVSAALKKGKYAIFADCGMGKTLMQLAWADAVTKETGLPVLILCPLAVSGQTILEGERFGVDVTRWDNPSSLIHIANYEQLKNIDATIYSGIVLDESSILKNYTGSTKRKIISTFEKTTFKLACTATPAPNDLNEMGNHSQFLDVMDAADMRMRWFLRDEGMNDYRLKKHAEQDFYGWIATWASVIRTPSDIGFHETARKYELPDLSFHTHYVDSKSDGTALFKDSTVNATSFNAELRNTMEDRINVTLEIVNGSQDQFIVWVNHNDESALLHSYLPDSVEVKGSDSPELKEKRFLEFAQGKHRVLITKKKIAQFGLNFQNCHRQVFASLDFSFEGVYQSIRRSHRFGQKKAVKVDIVCARSMRNVASIIEKKQKQYAEMMEKITKMVNKQEYRLKVDYDFIEEKNEDYHLMNGDSVELIKNIPDNSIDFSVFSPPFSTLFTYSDNIRDMGNCADDDEFFQQNAFLLEELYRVIKPGRLVAVHTKDIARYKNACGYSGMYDFTGDYHRAMEKAGFKYHSKVTIWIDPVLEMQRTKTQRLLYKQVTSDSTYTGIGMPEYVTIFRKWEGDEKEWEPVTNKTKSNFALDTWQKWASPVWSDIQRTNVLNNFKDATEPEDEKHICPLQLDVIERCIALWSNKGETVFSPFMGIGSEGFQAVKMERKFIGIELKPSYYKTAVKNIKSVAGVKQLSLL